jgi:hypothetical protein
VGPKKGDDLQRVEKRVREKRPPQPKRHDHRGSVGARPSVSSDPLAANP